MKSSIRIKVIIIGVTTSLLLMAIALSTTFIIYSSRAKKDYIQGIDRSLGEIERFLEQNKKIEFLYDYTDKIYETYSEDPNEPEFNNFRERYDYYQEKYNYTYPNKPGSMGMSYEKINNINDYLSISSELTTVINSTGGLNSYIVIPDKPRNRFIYIVSSDYHLTSQVDDNVNYLDVKLVGSYYTLKDSDEYDMTESEADYHDCLLRGVTCRYLDLRDDSGTFVARLIIEYDVKSVSASVNSFVKLEILTVLITTVLSIIVYALLAHQILVKNILKLNKSTNEFTLNIQNSESLQAIDPNIKTKDEVGTLSKSIVSLEEELISYAKNIEESTKEREKIQTELNVASKIQLETLPSNTYIDSLVSIKTSITSAKEVGGDFYDYFYLDNDNLCIVISDVSGKGVPASLFMMRSKELIKNRLIQNMSLENVCYEVNNELLINNDEGLFITAFIGILNINTGVLNYINAGHEKPYLISDNKVTKINCHSNFILGGIEDFEYVKDTLNLKINDRLFLHTDGLNESINIDHIEFGYDRIIDNLTKSINNSLDDVLINMSNSLKEFTLGEEPFDDVTMLLLEYKDDEINKNYINPDISIIDELVEKINNKFSKINKKTISEISIIIDELINNIISYKSSAELHLDINIKVVNKTFNIIIKDNNKEFNPLEVKDNYIDKYDESLTLGGFGITLVKKLSDELNYEYKDNHNILTIIKKG